MNQSIRDLMGELLRSEVFRDEDFIVSNGIKCLILKESKNEGENELREFRIKNVPDDSAVITLEYENLSKDSDKRKQADGLGVKKYICDILDQICSALRSKCSGIRKKIVNNLDYFSWLIIDGHKNAGKKCDIVIVTRDQNQINIIIGELKSQRIKMNNIKKKWKNSHYILKYIFELLEKYHIKGTKINYNYIYVLFTNSNKNLPGKNPVNQSGNSQRTVFKKVNNYDCIDFNDIV